MLKSIVASQKREKVEVPYRGYTIRLRVGKTRLDSWHAAVFIERRDPDHSSGAYDALPAATKEDAVTEGIKSGQAIIDRLVAANDKRP